MRRTDQLDRALIALLAVMFLFAALVVGDADVVKEGPYRVTFPILFAVSGIACGVFVWVDRAITYAFAGTMAIGTLVTRAVALVLAYIREDALIAAHALELRVAIYLGFAATLARLWAHFGAPPEAPGDHRRG